MNDVLAAAVELQTFFQEKHWTFCIIGGIALGRWGEPRTTVDVDVTLLTGFRDEENYVDQLLTRFRPFRSSRWTNLGLIRIICGPSVNIFQYVD